MNQTTETNVYYSQLDGAITAAEQRLRQFRSGSCDLLLLVYVDAEPPEDGPINLIHAPIAHLAELFLQTTLPLPEQFIPGQRDLPTAVIEHEEKRFFSTLDSITQARQQHLQGKKGSLLSVDTLFLHRNIAHAVAMQQNRVELGHPHIDGLQVCYYEGEPLDNSPENLIRIASADLVDYFSTTRLRRPAHLVIPPGVSEEDKKELQGAFKELRRQVVNNRDAKAMDALAACKALPPPPLEDGKPLRIYLPANRLTEVMQYASKGLANAFKSLGHEVWLSIEHNEMEELDYQRPDELRQFNPHLVININHIDNQWMHPDLYNVIWWQDPMPELFNNSEAKYREKDIIFTIDSRWIEELPQAQQKTVQVQNFCIDERIFHTRPEIEREEKVIFVGSSYRQWYRNSSAQAKVALDELNKDFSQGLELTGDRINFYAEKHNIPSIQLERHCLTYIVRDTSVRWLCEQDVKTAEIYGRGWEYDPSIMKKFKGQLPHGQSVAEVYSSAEYALVCIPGHIFSQRLAEASACGSIPIVYDSRYSTEPPYFEEQCLFYSTKDNLIEQLNMQPQRSAISIADNYTYRSFAQRIVDSITNSANRD